MKTVIVLGASGMLGSMVTDVLSDQPDLAVTAAVRSPELANRIGSIYPNVRSAILNFGAADAAALDELIAGSDWVINAVGITKPLIHDDNPEEIQRAIAVNAVLPHAVGLAAQRTGARVLQIATDCVYSGAKGAYTESDPHDALDVYGKTKSLGETWLPSTHHLRCSIIGPEPKEMKFLIEWFRRQPKGAQVNGFVNHRWNGVTTLHFAKLCLGVIRSGMELPHLQHVVPLEAPTKAEMLRAFAEAYDRPDIVIRDVEASTIIDRTLATNQLSVNAGLWAAAGYPEPPTVSGMIAELGAYDYRASLQPVAS